MKINYKLKLTVYIIGIILFLVVFLWSIFMNIFRPYIVDIKDNAVAYSDGTAEIAINDNFHGNYVVYSARVDAIYDGHYFAPNLIYRGGTWDRVVYTYAQDNYCEDKIFYMDRDQKSARVMNSDYCIEKTLDEHDIKCFFGTKNNLGEVVIGTYDNGAVISKIIIPYAIGRPINGSFVVSNWELTKLIVPVGNCDKGARDMKIFLWDVEAQIIEDKTPLNFNCNIEGIHYEHDRDIFYIKRANSIDEIIWLD